MKAEFGKSIGQKITLYVAVVIIVAMGITGWESFRSISCNMQKTVRSNLLVNAQDKANLLSTQIGCYKRFVKNASNSDAIKSMNPVLQQKQLKEDITEYGFLNMGISDSSGNTKFVKGGTEQLAYQNFYNNAQNNQTVTVSDPFMDDILKKMVIMIAAPVKGAGGKSAMTIGVIDANIVTTLTQNMSIGQSGYCFVLDETGTYVACKDKKKVTSSENVFTKAQSDKSLGELKNIASNMVSGKTDYAQFCEQGSVQCIAYAPIKDANWFLALRAPYAELFESANTMLKQVIMFTIIFILIAIVSVLALLKHIVTRPLGRTVKMIQEMSRGHIGVRLKVKTHDEIGRMAEAMNSLADMLEKDVVGTMRHIAAGDMSLELAPKDSGDKITPELINTIETVNEITQQTEMLISAAQKGQLSQRCDAERYGGSWRSLAEDINGLMDSVAAPINEVRSVVRRMAVNDYTHEVSGSYKGLFKELADDVNGVRRSLLDIQDVVVRVSKGDMSRLEEFRSKGVMSEEDSLTPAVATMMTTIENVAVEVKNLAMEGINGNVVGAKGDQDKFEGEYREIVQGFNDTLDAVARPIDEVQGVLKAMAVNDFTKSVSEGYKGDYLGMAQSINMVEKNLISMQNIAVKISQGDISELENYRAQGKCSENDRLVPAFTAMMESIKRLIGEVTNIAESAAAGRLDVRGKPEEFNGEYVRIVQSINELLDAVANPVGEVTRAMTSIAQANFDVMIEGDYNGQFKQLVDAVNKTAGDLKTVVCEISNVMLHISSGNLDIADVSAYNGEFSEISRALNEITGSLNDLIGNIDKSAEQVDAGARAVSNGSRMMSDGVSAQASSVEQLTSSIAEISSQTKLNAENAGKANIIAEKAKNYAVKGNSHMLKMLESISDITVSSQDISKIIKVIDDIAFQTKILALNAEVEAAHAGAYGKSFAVVADEVGNLAHKSAQAAQETSALIESTLEKVESGSKIANETAKALQNIVDHVDEVAVLVGGIAQSSNQQASGIAQIDSGIEQVSGVVQNNAAAARQSAAESEDLRGQSLQLKKMIGRFKLRNSGQQKANDK